MHAAKLYVRAHLSTGSFQTDFGLSIALKKVFLLSGLFRRFPPLSRLFIHDALVSFFSMLQIRSCKVKFDGIKRRAS